MSVEQDLADLPPGLAVPISRALSRAEDREAMALLLHGMLADACHPADALPDVNDALWRSLSRHDVDVASWAIKGAVVSDDFRHLITAAAIEDGLITPEDLDAMEVEQISTLASTL
jgi:hypothetical protein